MDQMMISNPRLLNCCICVHPLTIPVSQCDNGHVVCSTCSPKLRNNCKWCSLPISSKHCKAIENLLLSIEMSCPNAKHGCRVKISYIGNRKHEDECIYVLCYCPISDCGFAASSEVLSNHFSQKHRNSQIKFSYGESFIVSLKSNDEAIVLQEKNDGKLFILNNSTILLGNAVYICCIGPNSSESEYSYDILASSQTCKLILQSFVKNVQQFTLATLPSEFLVIPVGSSEPLKLEICISYITPMMEISINLSGKIFHLRVKISDMIVNVKEKIFYKEGIPVHQQRVIFGSKQLDDNLTLANCNIQEKSTLLVVLRLTGD